jgi:hypothetical protein
VSLQLSHRSRIRLTISAVTVAAVSTVGLAGASAAGRHHSQLPAPPSTPRERAAIETFAPYQSQFFCRSSVEPGVRAFEHRVLGQYKVSHSDGDMRGCDVGGTSEHKDGRAWDWGVDHRIPKQRAAGKSMLRWLFAADKYGNQDAMFRRLGLMYVIWNKRIWGAWSQHWEPYSCSGPTLCHVNHMHFSFDWAGAEKKTSYWTRKVAPNVEPPLPVLRKRHAHRALHVAAKTGNVDAMWLLKHGLTYDVTASGVWKHGPGAKARSDARCTWTRHGWIPTASGGVSIDGDHIDSWDEQWVAVHDSGNGCNTKTHIYRLVLDQSDSSTVSAELPDGSRGNDSGEVKLRFERD